MKFTSNERNFLMNMGAVILMTLFEIELGCWLFANVPEDISLAAAFLIHAYAALVAFSYATFMNVARRRGWR